MERRLTTILAADVVGYSRLMGADETARWRRSRVILWNSSIPKRRNIAGAPSSSWATAR
jgi:hypothetical protein